MTMQEYIAAVESLLPTHSSLYPDLVRRFAESYAEYGYPAKIAAEEIREYFRKMS